MRTLLLTLLMLTLMTATAQTSINLAVNGQTMTATLADNDATRELTRMLEEDPLTIDMSDYGGFEKVGDLPKSLPTADRQISTVPGDIMLYQGNSMVIFYGTNSWAYTPLGKIDGKTASEIKSFLAGNNVKVTISLRNSTAIEDLKADDTTRGTAVVYDLHGNRLRPNGNSLSPGIYIIGGKKVIIR